MRAAWLVAHWSLLVSTGLGCATTAQAPPSAHDSAAVSAAPPAVLEREVAALDVGDDVPTDATLDAFLAPRAAQVRARA
ncbi:MAG: hypothetical protein ACO3JL_16250, partial [Myxococcota bacterium]